MFDTAVKKTSLPLNAKKHSSPGAKKGHNRSLLNEEFETPGVGTYEIFDSGIGTSFGAVANIKARDSQRSASQPTASKDRKSRRREILLQNSRKNKIRGVSIPLAKRRPLNTVDAEIDVGPADYDLKPTVP